MRSVFSQVVPISVFSTMLGAILLGSSLMAAETKLTPRLSTANKAFEFGDCEKVISVLSDAQYVPYVDDEEHFLQIYRMLAICYHRKGEKAKAEKELQNLLILKPKVELDPFSTPPAVIDLFTHVKKTMAPKIEDIEKARAQIADQEKGKDPLQRTVVRRLSPLAAFVPFGFGQVENGHLGKGIALAASEIALLGVNVGSYWYKESLILPKSDALVADSSTLRSYNTAQTIQFVSIGVLAATYIYGIVDALIYRRPYVEESISIESLTGK